MGLMIRGPNSPKVNWPLYVHFQSQKFQLIFLVVACKTYHKGGCHRQHMVYGKPSHIKEVFLASEHVMAIFLASSILWNKSDTGKKRYSFVM